MSLIASSHKDLQGVASKPISSNQSFRTLIYFAFKNARLGPASVGQDLSVQDKVPSSGEKKLGTGESLA